jgi:hypothetical protein
VTKVYKSPVQRRHPPTFMELSPTPPQYHPCPHTKTRLWANEQVVTAKLLKLPDLQHQGSKRSSKAININSLNCLGCTDGRHS